MNFDMQLRLVHASGEAVLALIVPMEDEDDLFTSPATLGAVENLLMTMAQMLGRMPIPFQVSLPEIDWHGWHALHRRIGLDLQPRREEVWYAIRSLVPATLALLDRWSGRVAV